MVWSLRSVYNWCCKAGRVARSHTRSVHGTLLQQPKQTSTMSSTQHYWLSQNVQPQVLNWDQCWTRHFPRWLAKEPPVCLPLPVKTPEEAQSRKWMMSSCFCKKKGNNAFSLQLLRCAPKCRLWLKTEACGGPAVFLFYINFTIKPKNTLHFPFII